MTPQELLGFTVALVGAVLHLSYLRDALRGTIAPHPFTWLLWTVLTLTIFFAQLSEGAGPGAWNAGAVGFVCIAILGVAFKNGLQNGFENVKKVDAISLFLGVSAIPLWWVLKDPTFSVILITLVDVFAFVPTFRKSWAAPYSEPMYLYVTNALRQGLSIFAIININVATALFPFVMVLANLLLAYVLFYRRSFLRRYA